MIFLSFLFHLTTRPEFYVTSTQERVHVCVEIRTEDAQPLQSALYLLVQQLSVRIARVRVDLQGLGRGRFTPLAAGIS